MIVAALMAATGLAMGIVRPAAARVIFNVWLAAFSALLVVLIIAPDPDGAFNSHVLLAIAVLPLGLFAGWGIGTTSRRIIGGRRA